MQGDWELQVQDTRRHLKENKLENVKNQSAGLKIVRNKQSITLAKPPLVIEQHETGQCQLYFPDLKSAFFHRFSSVQLIHRFDL